MDSGHLFKNKVKQEINTGKKAVAQPWIQEVYKDPQLEFDVQTKSKKKSANKNVQQEQPIESSMTLLEAEQLHASSPDYENMKEADIRKAIFSLAISNQKGKAVEKIARDQILDQHEKKVEIADRKELIEETKDEVREFMLNPLLEREALKEMSSDKKLFESETVIADLKTQLEKIRYSLLYLGGTEEEKSKAILPDQDDQAMFIQKLQAARLLFSYREARLSICSNEYFNGRDLSRVMATQSANGKKMRDMLEQSRQRFLRLLDCAEHLPERELKDDEIEAELSQIDEDYGEFEIKDNLDEIMGKKSAEKPGDEVKEREPDNKEAQSDTDLEKMLKELLDEPTQEEIEKAKAKEEAKAKEKEKEKVQMAADEAALQALLDEQTPEEIEAQKTIKELTEAREKAISKKANEQRRELERKLLERKKSREQDSKKKEEDRKKQAAADEAELNAFLDEPVQKEKEAFEKKKKAEIEARKPEIEARKGEIKKKADEQRRELERKLADKKKREQEDAAEDQEFVDLLKDVKSMSDEEMEEFGQMMENGQEKEVDGFEIMSSVEEEEPLHKAQKKVQYPVVEKFPSVLQKDSDELASEVKRMEVKRQLAEDLAKVKTDNKDLNVVFNKLKEYTQINVTFGDAVTAYKAKGSNFKQTSEDLTNEKTLLYDAVSKLSDLSSMIENNTVAVDNTTKALVKKYYDRLKGECFGKLTFDKKYKVHVAKTSQDDQLRNGVKYNETVKTQTRHKEMLFSHEPCINDVNQGEFPDCMLISALASMVNKNPEMIREMMYDHGDSVTVRFFEQKKNGKYEPYYINVPKVSTDMNTGSALWVRIMESAYSTFMIYSQLNKSNANMGSWVRQSKEVKRFKGQVNLGDSPELIENQEIYANVHWLMSGDKNYETVYAALTGVTSEVHSRIASDKDYYTKRKTNNMALYLEQMKAHAGLDIKASQKSKAPKNADKFKEYITDRIITKLLSVHLFQREDYRDVENPEETLSFFSKKATIEDVQDLLTSLGKVTTQLLDKGAKAQEVVKYLKEYRLDSNLGNSLLKELKAFDPSWISFRSDLKQMIADRLALLGKQADKIEDLDHRGFGGEYTDHAIRTFDKIAGALAEGKSLGASTYAFRGNVKQTGPAAQAMVDGIVYGHQYTVIGVAEGKFKNAKYIKLRNPWGRYSKEYEVQGDQVVSKVKERTSGDPNHGIVYVELNEFMNKFREFTISPK